MDKIVKNEKRKVVEEGICYSSTDNWHRDLKHVWINCNNNEVGVLCMKDGVMKTRHPLPCTSHSVPVLTLHPIAQYIISP